MGIVLPIFRPRAAPSLEGLRRLAAVPPRTGGGWRRADPERITGSDGLPLVSVVTVCRNAAATIVDTIESVRRQSYPAIEHIVIDGGSTDGTVELLAARNDVIAEWRSEPDGGIYDAFNRGIALARGELIQIINADDRLGEDQIARAVRALRREPEADLVHGDVVLHGWRGGDVRITGDPGWARSVARRMPAIAQATVLARRRVFERAGLFRTDLQIASDYDWFIRVARAGCRSVHDPAVVAHMRAGGVSTTRQRRTITEGFACAWSNGDRSWGCVLHWTGRWFDPNGEWTQRLNRSPAARSLLERAKTVRTSLRRRAIAATVRLPSLRRMPGRGLIKRVVGVPSVPTPPPATGSAPALLSAFIEVRDLDGGLDALAIERLLAEAASLDPVAVIGDAPVVRQAAHAIRLGGGSIVETKGSIGPAGDGCRSVLMLEGEAALRSSPRVPTLIRVGPSGLRIDRSDP
jgi:glycosyltransferase involved in cell wall biosynthesis